MKSMKDIFDWIVKSSANPENISLFIKGLAGFGVLFGVDSAVIVQFGNELAHLVAIAAMAVASVISLYGLVRKIYITVMTKFA